MVTNKQYIVYGEDNGLQVALIPLVPCFLRENSLNMASAVFAQKTHLHECEIIT